ncbi:MAG: hypothetical protein J7501_16685, partial [Bdellovibrio sp.]|nr:hypothetical protein [Bdellovibrio sp.]
MHYSVKLQCEPPGQAFLATPLKNQKFKWRFGDLAKSELVTDNTGTAEFTYTSHDGKINEVLEIEIEEKTYRFSSAEGMATIPKFSRCP